MKKQKVSKFRNLTEDEVHQYEVGKARLLKDIQICEAQIKEKKINIDNVDAIMFHQLEQDGQEIKEYQAEILKLNKNAEGYELRKKYFEYLIQLGYHEINEGRRLYFESKSESLSREIKQLEQTINTNKLVIEDINKKLQNKKVEMK